MPVNYIDYIFTACYGINELTDCQEWKCDRCLVNDFNGACCLCPLRGGALKKTVCGQWAHLTCALVLSNVKIDSDILMKPIDISSVQSALDSDRNVSNCASKNYFRFTCSVLNFF